LVVKLSEHIRGRGPGDLVFTTATGARLRNSNFHDQCWDEAVARCGLSGLRVHDLRHTAASLAVAAGANVKAVQRMLGHASAAMTLDVYAGLFNDDLDEVAEGLDRAKARSERGLGADWSGDSAAGPSPA
jgi:integrase